MIISRLFSPSIARFSDRSAPSRCMIRCTRADEMARRSVMAPMASWRHAAQNVQLPDRSPFPRAAHAAGWIVANTLVLSGPFASRRQPGEPSPGRQASRAGQTRQAGIMKKPRAMRNAGCKVCRLPASDQAVLERLHCSGASFELLAERYSTQEQPISRWAIARHCQHHLTKERRAELMAGPAKLRSLVEMAAEEIP